MTTRNLRQPKFTMAWLFSTTSFLLIIVALPVMATRLQAAVKEQAIAAKTVFAPLVFRAPEWQRVSAAGQPPLDVIALALHGQRLFAGDQAVVAQGGGIYRTAELSDCRGAPAFARVQPMEALSLAFVSDTDSRGLAGSYGGRAFYTRDGGASWQVNNSTGMNPYVYTVEWNAATGPAYAGADNGVYLSNDDGTTWALLNGGPPVVNVLKKLPNYAMMWVGTNSNGVWKLAVDTQQFASSQFNLPNARIWDIVADEAGNVWIATDDGVFVEDVQDGLNQWQAVGLQGSEVYSLAIGNSRLFAGLRRGGVQRANLALLLQMAQGQPSPFLWQPETNGAGWNPQFSVRDLLYDDTVCQGLLAATGDGVWLFR